MFDDDVKTTCTAKITVLQMHALVWTWSLQDLSRKVFGLSDVGLKRRLVKWPVVLPTLSDRLRMMNGKSGSFPKVPPAIATDLIETTIDPKCDLDAMFREPSYLETLKAIQHSESTPITRMQFYELRWSVQSSKLQKLLGIGQSAFFGISKQFNIPIPPTCYFVNGGIAPGSKRDPLPEASDEVVFVCPKRFDVSAHVNPAPLRTTALSDELGPEAAHLVELWLSETQSVRAGHSQEVIVRGLRALQISQSSAGQIAATLLELPSANTIFRTWKRDVEIEYLSFSSVDAVLSLARFMRNSQSEFVRGAMDLALANPEKKWVFGHKNRRPRKPVVASLRGLVAAEDKAQPRKPVKANSSKEPSTAPQVAPEFISAVRIVPGEDPVPALFKFMTIAATSEPWLGSRDRAIFELMANCGLMPRGIVSLLKEDVDLALAKLTYSPRGDLKLTLDIPFCVMPSLIDYNRKRPISTSEHYFIGDHGEQIRRTAINEILDRRCAQMGCHTSLSPKSLVMVNK